MNIDKYCVLLPKVELHSHVSGAVPDRILRKLIKERFPNENEETLYQTCKFGSQESRNLKSGFRMFEVLHEISNSLSCVEEIIEGILEDYYTENCVLLELRTGPRIVEDGNKEDYVRKILDTMKSFCQEKEGKFFCGLNLSINRSKSLEVARSTFDLFEKLLPEYPDFLLGFDFSGNYRDKNFSEFKDVFEDMKIKGYKVTAHFAEVKNDEDSFSILKYKPDRLGHGLFTNDEMIDDMLRKCIPMELCISGNCISGKVLEVEHHPFFHFYRRYGYPYSINTDDRGIFSLTISGEYSQIGRVFQLDKDDLYQISYRAIRHSFLNEETKKKVQMIFTKFRDEQLSKITHLILPSKKEEQQQQQIEEEEECEEIDSPIEVINLSSGVENNLDPPTPADIRKKLREVWGGSSNDDTTENIIHAEEIGEDISPKFDEELGTEEYLVEMCLKFGVPKELAVIGLKKYRRDVNRVADAFYSGELTKEDIIIQKKKEEDMNIMEQQQQQIQQKKKEDDDDDEEDQDDISVFTL